MLTSLHSGTVVSHHPIRVCAITIDDKVLSTYQCSTVGALYYSGSPAVQWEPCSTVGAQKLQWEPCSYSGGPAVTVGARQ